jgi:CBS domain-containing protein
MTVGEIARDRVVTASPDTPIKSIVESMAEHDVGCIIIEQHDEPIGLITDRKIALQLKDTPAPSSHAVKEYMTTGLVTVHEEEGVKEASDTLSDAGVRRVPVVDDSGELVGVLSIDDLAVLFADEMEDIAAVAAKQSPRF